MNNINYTEIMNNDEVKAPMNSEIVQKLYNSIAIKYDFEVDDIESFENNLKILESTNDNSLSTFAATNEKDNCIKIILLLMEYT